MPLVDKSLALDHPQRGVNPPRVAHVGQLLGPAVEAALERLPLAQPVGQVVLVEGVELVRDLQSAHAAKHVGAVAFRLRLAAKPALSLKNAILRRSFCILECIGSPIWCLFCRVCSRARARRVRSRRTACRFRPVS